MINLLIVIDLFVRVFIFCKHALFVFCQKYRFLSILLHSILLFFVLFYEPFIESTYQLSMYQNLCEFAQRALLFNLNMKLMKTVTFLLFYFPSEVVHLTFPPHILFCLNKVWNMLHHGSVGRVQNKIKNTNIF